MHKHRLIIASVAIILIFSLLLAGCGQQKADQSAKPSSGQASPPADKIKFKIGYLPAVGHILYFVAKEKGFYEQEGLDVELFQFTNSGEGLNAIKAGKLDAGSFGTAAPQVFIAKGTPFVDIGGMQSEGHAVVAKPENAGQFSTPQGFIGKKVATVRLATGDAVWRSAMSKAGIDWKNQVTIQELDSPTAVLEAVKKGAADAGLVWVPFSEMAEQQGLKIVTWSSEYMDGHVCCRVVALEDKLQSNKEAYIRYARASIRAYDFYINNQEETLAIAGKYVKLDKELLKKGLYGGRIHSIPDPDKKRFIAFWEAMKAAGYIQSDIDIAKHVNTEIYKTALDQLLQREPQNATYQKLANDYQVNDL
ncbi:ABC transporter substrate-binding protein [Sporomusa acidovorans]|uniref:Solute-binding protein family 3/N-terminal domain-containing protein n=1 Tax=Sporomusa acidovorans (strain ATCC 49682 / DSM 3132 / Mol) TaxID=1123286 RepID=A0ABZ3IZ56_SPOA4|nr:ABC transporter substrate-binding protein [Sporomusa acidovorans]OZC16863.1 putative aliphatic sulfonates-binding protein precursor [Sporomusa acidovorans DSM 3132]SDF24622.1 NitT/TauT family transport system substrate-binding protein [Sporomusa acidovorans]